MHNFVWTMNSKLSNEHITKGIQCKVLLEPGTMKTIFGVQTILWRLIHNLLCIMSTNPFATLIAFFERYFRFNGYLRWCPQLGECALVSEQVQMISVQCICLWWMFQEVYLTNSQWATYTLCLKCPWLLAFDECPLYSLDWCALCHVPNAPNYEFGNIEYYGNSVLKNHYFHGVVLFFVLWRYVQWCYECPVPLDSWLVQSQWNLYHYSFWQSLTLYQS